MQVKFKKLHSDAVLPQYMTEGAVAMDVTAISMKVVQEDGYGYMEYGLGWAVEIPPGYEMQIRSRSSIRNKGLIMTNSVGTVDSDYRGEVTVSFKYIAGADYYNVGARIAQILFVPVLQAELIEVEELSETIRGEGGHGSTNGI